jgi:hypothetical protein
MPKLANLILIVLLIIGVVWAIAEFNLIGKLNIIFPSFGNVNPEIKDSCTINLGLNGPNGLVFLSQGNKPLTNSNIFIEGNEIKIAYTQIGSISSKRVIVLDSGMINRNNKVYADVQNDLPDFFFIKNLNGSYLEGNKICRSSLVYPFESTKPQNYELFGKISIGSSWPYKLKILILSGENDFQDLDIFISGDQIFAEGSLLEGAGWQNVFFGQIKENRISISEDLLKNNSQIINSKIEDYNLKNIEQKKLTLQQELLGAEIIEGLIYRVK